MLPDSIYIVTPERYQHSETFRELAEAFREGCAELGEVVPITTVLNSDRPLVLGAHLLPELPANAIIYNTEQVGSHWLEDRKYIDILKVREVWDYSAENTQRLKELGINAKHCDVGYEPCLTRIPQLPEEKLDIDVLFYGSPTPRRMAIIEEIIKAGVKVQMLFGVYGVERDYYISRSKIVLNLHAWEYSPHEIVRASYLWANKKCVVDEDMTNDLPTLCKFYVENRTAREALAERAFHRFTKVRQSEYLKGVLFA